MADPLILRWLPAREERERTLETAIEGGLKGIATALSHTTDPEVCMWRPWLRGGSRRS